MLKRYHGVDFARAILMLLGIIYHTALIYSPGIIWAANSTEKSAFFHTLAFSTSSFRMHSFYILAGFFFMLQITKIGAIETFKDRLIRLGVPMIFVGFTINLVANFYADNYTFPTSRFDYLINGEWLRHLWFIGNLIVYCMLFCVTYYFFKKTFFNRRVTIVLLVIFTPILTALIKDQAWRITGYGSHFFITPKDLLVYLPYFLLGTIAFQHRDIILSFISYKNAMKVLLIPMILYIARLNIFSDSERIYLILSEGISLYLSFAVIILLCKIGEDGGNFSKLISDSSYTIYLVHSPIIIFLYNVVFTESQLNIFMQYILICLITLSVSYLFHNKVILKSKVLLFLFNGKYK
jgi:glucan biosynthesis protein C